MIEITKGRYVHDHIDNDITLGGKLIVSIVGAHISDTEQEGIGEIIEDALNTYHQCSKLPSELLAENKSYSDRIEQFYKDVQTFLGEAYSRDRINDGVYDEIDDLLTKLKTNP